MKNGYYSIEKRLLAVILSLMMIFQMMPAGVLAEGGRFTSDPVAAYTVTWEIDGQIGTYMSSKENMLLSDILPENPEKEGDFRFVGWADRDGNPVNPQETLVTADIYVKAVFEDNSKTASPDNEPAEVKYYSVRFGANGETVETRQVAEGEAIGAFPEAPAREGYTFHHWMTAGQGNEVNAGTIVTADMEIVTSYTCDYPALNVQGFGNGWTVSVKIPEGALPETTMFRVLPVNGEKYRDAVESAVGGSVGNITAVDLFFVDRFNRSKEIEPLKPVTVKVSIPGLDNSKTHSVVHVKDNGEAEVVQSGVSGSNFTFEADQFSIYAVTDDKIVTFNFYDGDGNLITSEYIKKNKDGTVQDLYNPSFTLEYGEGFYGWAGEEHAQSGKTISQLNEEIESSWSQLPDQVNYYAVIKKVYVIRYQKYDSNGKLTVLKTVEIPVDADAAEKTYTIEGDLGSDTGATFLGWMTQDGTVKEGETIQVNKHWDLYLKETGRYWLVFDNNAGGPGSGVEYIPPQLVFGEGKVTVKPEDPERAGYSFLGWNTTEDGTGEWWYKADGSSASQFGGTLTEDVTLFAQWEAAPTRYHVVFWQQNAADEVDATDDEKHYSYVGGYEISENVFTGDTVTVSDKDKEYEHEGSVTIGKNTVDFKNYHFNETKTDGSKVAAADGSTTLNVYYDLDDYTLSFQIEDYTYTATTSNSGTQYGVYEGEYVRIYYNDRDGKWYRTITWHSTGMFSGYWDYSDQYTGPRYTRSNRKTWQTIKEIHALVGHNISNNFPIAGTNGITYNDGQRWDPQNDTEWKEVMVYVETMPARNVTFRLSTSTNDIKTMYYMVEALPDDTNTEQFDGKQFVVYNSIGAKYYGVTVEDYVDLSGFGKYAVSPEYTYNNGVFTYYVPTQNSEEPATVVRFYYLRNRHNIHYISGSSSIDSDSIMFGQKLNEYGPDGDKYYIPTNGQDGYAFVGWYTDENFAEGTEFNFKGTMPDNTITLYAKWEQQRVRVVLDPNAPAGSYSFENNQALSFRLNYNEKIKSENITGSAAVRAGYELDHWETLDGGIWKIWNFETQVNENSPGVNMDYQNTDDWKEYGDNDGEHANVKGILKLRAVWKLNVKENSVYVIYKVGDGYLKYNSDGQLQTIVPVDNKNYTLQEEADSVSFQAHPAPVDFADGYEFSGWALLDATGAKSGTIFQSGQSATVNDTYFKTETLTDSEGNSATFRYIVLEAEFTPKENMATMVILDGNHGTTASGSTTVEQSYLVNKSFEIPSGDLFTRERYTFKGWNTQADGEGTWFEPGTIVAADNLTGDAWNADNKDNILYAIWQPNIVIDVEGTEKTEVYNGQEQSNKEYTVKYRLGDEEIDESQLPAGVTVTIDESLYTAAIGLAVRDYEAEPLNEDQLNALITVVDINTPKYKVERSYTPAKLHIVPIPLTITINNKTVPYNGEVQYGCEPNDYTVTGLMSGDVLTVTGYVPASGKTVGTYTNGNKDNVTVTITNNGNDVKSSYNVTVVPGKLEIEPAKVTITAENAKKTYDGKALTEDGFKVTGQADTDTHEFAVVMTAASTITDVGTQPNVIATVDGVAVTTGTETAVGNYLVTTVNGTLTITPADISDTTKFTVSDPEDTMYNGAEQKQPVTVKNGEAVLVAGTDYEVAYSENVTDAGTVTVKITGKGNYTGTVTKTYKITKRKVTLTSETASKPYDGEALTRPTVETTGDGFVAGEVSNIHATGSVITVAEGEVTNAIEYTEEAAFKADNYEITKNEGKLKITEADISDTTKFTVSDPEDTMYNGAEQKQPVTVKNGEAVLVAGTDYEVAYSENITDAGTVTVKITGKGNYTGTVTKTYEITPRPVTVTAKSQEFTYDGNAHSNYGYDVAGLVGNDALTAVVEGSITLPSESPVANVVKSHNFTKGDAGNYTVSYVHGQLTMKNAAVKITITAASQEWTYDGKAHSNSTVTVTAGKLLTGDTLVATATGSATNVADTAEGNNPIANGYKVMHGDKNVTDNYTITAVAGTLTINPKAVTVTVADAPNVVYDGEEHTGIAAYTFENVVTGQTATITYTPAKGRLVGTYTGTYGEDFKVMAGTKDVTANYELTSKAPGKLTITDGSDPDEKDVPDNLVVTKNHGSTNSYRLGDTVEWTITVKNIYNETKELTVTEAEGMTIVGEVPSSLAAGATTTITARHVVTVEDVENEEITNTVTIKLGDLEKTGSDTVETEPIAIEITAASANKVYDGDPLTNNGYELTSGKLLEGDKFSSVTVAGTQTLVGSSANVASNAKIVDGNNADVTAGYAITYKPGTLTVTDGTTPGGDPVPDDKVVTKTDNSDKKYKLGETIEWTVTVTNIYDAEKSLTVTEAAGMTIVGTVPATLKAGEATEIKVQHVVTAADVAAGSIKNEVTVKLGDLEKKGDDTVETEPIQITITAASDSKVYDGTALTNNGYELTSGTLNTGDRIDNVTVTGTQTLVGSSANVASNAKIVNAAGNDVTAGYKVTYADGTLTVTDGTTPGGDPVPDDKVVTKTDNSDKTYKLGETIEWTVTVTNIYDAEKSLTITEAAGMTIVGTVPATLKAGEVTEIKVQHVVTAADVAAGSIKNEVTVKLGDLEKKGDDTVETEPIQITITAASDSKVYDGTALTNNGYELTSGTLNTGDRIDSVTVTGTQTLVGSSANVASAAKIMNAAGNDVTAGYKVTYAEGLLTVTDGTSPAETDVPDNLVVTKDDGRNTTYRMGDTVTWTVSVKNIYDETKTLTVTEAPGMTIVGTVPATLTAGQEITIRVDHVVTAADAAAGNIKNDVTVKIGDLEKKGEDTVTTAQIPITVTAASATKEYDGTALTNGGYTLTSGLLSNGHTIQSITVTGSQTEVGSSANVASGMVITDAAGNNVTAGYAITYANGTLTVTEQEQQNQGVQTYTLTIQYWMDGKVTSTVRRTAASGTAYDVVTPPVEGYTPDLERVSGTLTANTEYDVVYTVNEYTLTIRYVYPNGEPATDPFVGGFLFGEDYSIPAPMIPGLYTANRLVTGTMPARDVTVTVIFAEAENLIHIDDFETPLGLGLGSINAGETIE